jgi:DNA mismatch repair protein MutS
VIERAKVVLEALEQGEREGGKQATLIDDLPLFRAAPPQTHKPTVKESPVEARLRDIHPDELTPMEALRLIYELKQATTI